MKVLDLFSGIARCRELEAALRRADDIEHSISAEDWYKQRDALLGSSKETQAEPTFTETFGCTPVAGDPIPTSGGK